MLTVVIWILIFMIMTLLFVMVLYFLIFEIRMITVLSSLFFVNRFIFMPVNYLFAMIVCWISILIDVNLLTSVIDSMPVCMDYRTIEYMFMMQIAGVMTVIYFYHPWPKYPGVVYCVKSHSAISQYMSTSPNRPLIFKTHPCRSTALYSSNHGSPSSTYLLLPHIRKQNECYRC